MAVYLKTACCALSLSALLGSYAHANPINYFNSLFSTVNGANGAITIYFTDWDGLPVTNSNVQTWIAQGHEFGVHPYGNPQPTNYTKLYQGFVDSLNKAFADKAAMARLCEIAWPATAAASTASGVAAIS